jgi:hypothetical protein
MIEEIPGCCTSWFPIGSDETTVWLSNDFAVTRFDPSARTFAEQLSIASARFAVVVGDRAFVSVEPTGLVEVDLTTNQIVRTIKLGPTSLPLASVDGSVWVTDREADILWRIEP